MKWLLQRSIAIAVCISPLYTDITHISWMLEVEKHVHDVAVAKRRCCCHNPMPLSSLPIYTALCKRYTLITWYDRKAAEAIPDIDV